MTTAFTYETFCDELDQIFTQAELNTRLMSLSEIGHVALGMALRPSQGDQPTICVTLVAGLTIPAEVQYLAWGLVDAQGDLVATGRTSPLGQFVATVPEGVYRVRFVAEPTTWLDRTILRRIGDYAAECDVRRYDRDRTLPTPLAETWPGGRRAVGVALDTAFSSDGDDGDELAPNVDVGWTRNGLYFKVRLSDAVCTREDFPFGMLLLQHVSPVGRVIMSRLTPIQHQTDETGQEGQWISIEERTTLLGEAVDTGIDSDANQVIAWIVTAQQPELLAAISEAELHRYQTDWFVRSDPQLLAGARQLEAIKRQSSVH
jgi:hypothetical protein